METAEKRFDRVGVGRSWGRGWGWGSREEIVEMEVKVLHSGRI